MKELKCRPRAPEIRLHAVLLLPSCQPRGVSRFRSRSPRTSATSRCAAAVGCIPSSAKYSGEAESDAIHLFPIDKAGNRCSNSLSIAYILTGEAELDFDTSFLAYFPRDNAVIDRIQADVAGTGAQTSSNNPNLRIE